MASGSKPGERRGGRQPGTPNKTTKQHKATITELAQAYLPRALEVLAEIMEDEKAPAPARATAANSLIDRGYGKPRQPVEHEIDLNQLPDQVIEALLVASGRAPAPGSQAVGGTGETETLN